MPSAARSSQTPLDGRAHAIIAAVTLALCVAAGQADAAVADLPWALAGTASYLQTGNVVLTQNSGAQAGAMWNRCSLDLTKPFDVTWDLNFGGNNYGCGADGMAFALQKNGVAVLGADSGEHGYDNGGINSGIAVYMDTWTNAVGPYNDPAYDSLGVNVNGTPGDATNGCGGGTAITGPCRPGLLPGNAQVTDGLNHTVEYVWTPAGLNATLAVKVDGNLRGTWTFNNFAVNWFGGDATAVNWGMTASTGGAYNLQQAGVDSISTINGVAVTSAAACAVPTPTPNVTPSPVVTVFACAGTTPVVPTCGSGIVVDGALNEPVYAASTWYNDNNVDGGSAAAGNAARFQAHWDSTNLYVSVSVLKTGPLYTATTQGNFWRNDSIDVYWNSSDSHGGSFGIGDGQLTFEWGQTASNIYLSSGGGMSTAGIQYQYATNPGVGWTAEIAIPWGDLGVAAPAMGNSFGFDTDVNFSNGQDSRQEQLTWFNAVDGNDYNSTTHYGTMTLGAACSTATPTPSATSSTVYSPTVTPTLTRTFTPAPTSCVTPIYRYSDLLAQSQDNSSGVSFTLGHGGTPVPDGLILVYISVDSGAGINTTTVTYGGVAMQSLPVQTGSAVGGGDLYVFYLAQASLAINGTLLLNDGSAGKQWVVQDMIFGGVNTVSPIGAETLDPTLITASTFTSNFTTFNSGSAWVDYYDDGNNCVSSLAANGTTQTGPLVYGSTAGHNDLLFYRQEGAAGPQSLRYVWSSCGQSLREWALEVNGALCPSPTPTATASGTVTVSMTPSLTVTRTYTPSPSATPTPSPCATPTPSPSSTPGMELVKSASVGVATLGDTITFCLQWKNDSQSSVPMLLWDSLQPYLSYLGCDHGCTEAGQLVDWNLGLVLPGATGTACFWAKVSGYP